MAYDLSALATTIGKAGKEIILQMVNSWEPGEDFGIIRDVTKPIFLPKLSIAGEPRPYRAQEDTSGNNAVFTDRTLTVNQSKWDFIFDPEDFRNTYLSDAQGGILDPNQVTLNKFIINKIAEDYLAKINDEALLDGVYNAAGTGTADIMDGLRKILSTAGLTPVATGSFNGTNAVTKVEQVCEAVPQWMRKSGFKVICSYTAFDHYKKHYRTLNNIGFDQRAVDSINLDGFKATLEPRSYMGTSLALIAIPATKKNLWLGLNSQEIAIHPTPTLNLMKVRLMMPIGLQVADTEAVVINDQL